MNTFVRQNTEDKRELTTAAPAGIFRKDSGGEWSYPLLYSSSGSRGVPFGVVPPEVTVVILDVVTRIPDSLL